MLTDISLLVSVVPGVRLGIIKSLEEMFNDNVGLKVKPISTLLE